MIAPLAIDVSARSVTIYQVALAAVLVGLFGLGLAIAGYRIKFHGLTPDLEREKRALLGQRETTSPASLRIDESEFGEGVRGLVDDLFDPARQGEAVDSRTTFGDAIHETRMAIALGYRGIADRLPSLSLYLLEEAVLVIVLGSVAVESVGFFETLFAGGGGGFPLSPAGLASGLIDLTVSTVTGMLQLALLSPLAAPAIQLLPQLGLTAATALYQAWLVLALLLVGTAAGTVLLDRLTPDVDLSIGVSRYRAGALGIGALVGIWVLGVVPVLTWGAVGFQTVGFAIGALLSVEALVGACVYGGWRLVRLLRALGRGEAWDRQALAVLVARRWSQALAFVTAPLILAYLIVAVAEGKLVAVGGAFLAAPLPAKVLVGLLVVAGVAPVVWQLRPAWPAFYAAFRDVLSRRAVRIVLFRRAVPVSLVALGYFVALGFGVPWWLALAIGLVLGVVTALLVTLLQRARYQVSLLGRRDPVGASRVIVHGYRLETTTGDPLYYATVNSVEVAHRDRAALVDAILVVAGNLFERGSTDPSIPRRFAADAFEYGIVDVEETRQRCRGHVTEDVVGTLRKENGMADVETVHDRLDDYPDELWRDELRTLRRRGDLRQRKGHYILSR